MALIEPIIANIGPLPISVQYTGEGVGSVLLYIAGSAWSPNEGTDIGIGVYVDGNLIGNATVFTNESGSHKALIPSIIPFKVDGNEHTMTVEALTGTNTDLNDQFYVSIIY